MLNSFKEKPNCFNLVCAVLTLVLLVFRFTPYWFYGEESISVNGYAWLEPGNTEIANWFVSQLGSAIKVDYIVIVSVLTLVLGALGIFFCIKKAEIGLVAILPAGAAITALYSFAFMPVFRLGATWIVQLVICVALLIVAIISITYGLKNRFQEAKGERVLSQNAIKIRLNTIKVLGEPNTKKSSVDDNACFHKLLTFLTDEAPECRVAAAEALGKSSREVAITHITHLLEFEKDENVIRAMRNALTDIRKNIEKLNTKNV